MSRIGVVVPAAGSGARMGGAFKPFLDLSGVPMLARSLAPFFERDDVVSIVVALPAALAPEPPPWLVRDPRVRIVPGGAERGDSVRNALAALPADLDTILVHDAARPLVTAEVIERCAAAAASGRSVIAGVPVTDTIQQVASDGTIVATPDRASLRAAQTPQAFPATVIREAYARAAQDGIRATDDAALVARCGVEVVVVEGAQDNIKITTPADLALAEAMLARARGGG